MHFLYDDKVLVVGAGGIGCELLKNLVMVGFRNIEVLDLDTIELSNLNRQFLFHRPHVGHPKSVVAAEAVSKFRSNVKVIPHVGDILSYTADFFAKFKLVFTALDNKIARSYVNRMCVAAKIPIIEAGTAGFAGQSNSVISGITECYDCRPKPAAKTFPGCTIRNTPSQFIHCVIWSKALFSQLFGLPSDEDDDVSPDPQSFSSEEHNNRRISTRQWAENCNYAPSKIFNKVFHEDIEQLLSMTKLWENRVPPVPLLFDDLTEESSSTTNQCSNDNKVVPNDMVQWNLAQCKDIFVRSLNTLRSCVPLEFDKDDGSALDFVCSAANIRAHIFHIPMSTRFKVKSLAGNIIPAVATTNAIVAGLSVLQGISVLSGSNGKVSLVKSNLTSRRNHLIASFPSPAPDPLCYVCSVRSNVSLRLNIDRLTLDYFRRFIIEQVLQIESPDVTTSDGRILLSYDQNLTDEFLSRPLSSFGIKSGMILDVEDINNDSKRIKILLRNCSQMDNTDFEFVYTQNNETVTRKRRTSQINGASNEDEDDNNEKKPKYKITNEELNSNEDDDNDNTNTSVIHNENYNENNECKRTNEIVVLPLNNKRKCIRKTDDDELSKNEETITLNSSSS